MSIHDLETDVMEEMDGRLRTALAMAKEHRIPLQEISKVSGTSIATVWRWREEGTTPTLPQLQQVLKAIKILVIEAQENELDRHHR